MRKAAGWGKLGWLVFLAAGSIAAQTLTNQALNGKYFFRYVSLGTDASGNLTDPRSLIGTMTFDGAGHYSFAGQQVIGANAAASATGSGAYAVDPAGFVSLDSPIRSGDKVNARVGPEALLGSGTESTDNTFDMLVAIPAPTGSAPALTGPYWTVTIEFPGGSTANARNTIFSLSSSAQGQFATFNVQGHAANLLGGLPTTQPVTGATYTMAADGTGSASFGTASNSSLLSGSKALYISSDGNVILGGSTAAGSHDMVIGVKAASSVTATTWNGDYWGAGLRADPNDPGQAPVLGYAGSVAARGTGNLWWTKRFKSLGFGTTDFTGVTPYTLNADGSGAEELSLVGLGAGGQMFVGSVISGNDPGYEIYFGAPMTQLKGAGVFVNPQKIQNASSFAPAGNPISPGEFIAIFGTGMAAGSQTAKPPYPLTLNGVIVTVNGKQAPLYYVSATQINALVPYSTQGPTATVVVQNGSASSTAVTVPVAATAPGIFSADSSGSGLGAVLHASTNAVVNATNPAIPGEYVSIYLTGLGAVSPAVPDGTAAGSSPLSNATATPIFVLIGGQPITPLFSGLAPGFPGLYQINVQVPIASALSGNLPLAISTPNAFHDQVSLPVQ